MTRSDSVVAVGAPHFESLEHQAHAARFGMWVFLASEVLLFTGLFAMFIAYGAEYPKDFRDAVAHNTKLFGSINTGVLLVSSWAVATSVHALRADRRAKACVLLLTTLFLGGAFLCIKAVEYARHFEEGIFPGGRSAYFAALSGPGQAPFWTLYYVMTGLHAIHVTVGMGILAFFVFGIGTGRVTAPFVHRLEIGAIYWHLVDVIWIFLWPLFYLA